MRAALVLVVVLTGCPQPPPTYPPPDPPPGFVDAQVIPYGCTGDPQCPATAPVCARTGECLLAADVRAVHVAWTVHGAAADATTCASTPDLEVEFYDPNGGNIGYAPVPCAAGLYTIDKLPTRFDRVRMALIDTQGGGEGPIDSSGHASVDLPY